MNMCPLSLYKHLQSRKLSRAAVLCVVAAVVLTLSIVPTTCAQALTSDTELLIPEVTLGGTRFRLMAANTQIPTDGAYSYTVEVTPHADLRSASLHFELQRGDNKPFHWTTQYLNTKELEQQTSSTSPTNKGGSASSVKSETKATAAKPRIIRKTFERREGLGLSGLGMDEGIYQVACTITVRTADGQQESASLRDLLVVYDPTLPAQKILPVFHLSAPPARDSQGRFISDPTQGTFGAQQQFARQLATFVANEERARVTLALSPLLVGEWADCANGYTWMSGDGSAREVSANAGAAPACKQTIAALKTAVASGRLSLTVQGYSDPDFYALRVAGREHDLLEQYQQGIEVLQNHFEGDVLPLTAPLNSHVGEGDIALLEQALEQPSIIVRSAILASGSKKQPNVVLRAGTNSRLLVADDALSALMREQESNVILRDFLHQRTKSEFRIVSLNCPADAAQLSLLERNFELLTQYRWLEFIDAHDDAVSVKKGEANTAKIAAVKLPEQASEGWRIIAKARLSAEGLESALLSRDQNKDNVTITDAVKFCTSRSLMAEAGTTETSSAVATSGAIAPVANETCLSLALATLSKSDEWFKTISLRMQAITLSGSQGKLPVTIQNDSGKNLTLSLRLVPANENVSVKLAEETLDLPPNETFIEPSIELRNIISSTVKAQLMAGPYVVFEKSVRVSASYSDKIGIIALVAVAGGVLIIYLWRRTRNLPEANEDQAPEETMHVSAEDASEGVTDAPDTLKVIDVSGQPKRTAEET